MDGNLEKQLWYSPSHDVSLPCFVQPSQDKCKVSTDTLADETPIVKKKSNDKDANNTNNIIQKKEIIIPEIQSRLIDSTKKYEGLINVTQISKGSIIWVAEDGRQFEKNDFDSFKLLDEKHMVSLHPEPILLNNDRYSIQSKETMTVDNIVKFYQYKLDDSFSDEFINVISEYGSKTVSWKYFNTTNSDPLSFSKKMISVVLPFKRGGTDVYNISDDRSTWVDKEGIQYSKNSYDSFSRITPVNSEKKCSDTPIVMVRKHCDFDKIKQYEINRATEKIKSLDKKIFDKSYGEIDNIFAYDYPKIDSRTQFLIDHNLLEFARGYNVDTIQD
jgi:hypothetical protein